MRNLHGRMLVYLDQVARAGSIRRAATKLNVAASSINRQILQLEEDLGMPIFERLARRLRLTAAGEVLITHIRATLSDAERVAAHLEDLKGLRRGEVSIATMSGLASNFLTQVAVDFRERHPRVKLMFDRQTLGEIVTMVAAGEADLGLAFDVPADPRLRVLLTVPCALGVVVVPGHKLAAMPRVRLSDCVDYPMILPSRSMTMRRRLDDAFARASITINAAIETNEIEMIKRFAALDRGVAFLNAVNVDVERRRGELAFVPIQDSALPPQFLTLFHREKTPLSLLASLFTEELKAALSKL
jgi:DNA-binding transcriptional LysR family regulator